MKTTGMTLLAGAALGVAATGSAQAAEILVSSDITTSTVWTADNTYNLQQQIFVKNGATLTIEAGTVVASTTNLGGSLAVSRGSQIFVQGTSENPVIMTSKADVMTWDADPGHPTGGDPTTGSWREAANEWGNLTIMGRGRISASHFGGLPVVIDGVPNGKCPDGTAQKQMEGLVAVPGQEADVRYGGNDDNDDSGSISYLSLRYGGRVIGLGNELNGLSLGAVGRETDIDHVEIMNNVDDGIEIWGGTVDLKHISIWNVGDDSFDVDQGWRGRAQFILIVQGFSLNASQGSGVGDNGFETDGAEDSDAQPLTTAAIYNATFIGQPVDGDGATTWRDNARVQYRNCIFMDCGEKVVRFDDDDGDGTLGYGNGHLSWPDTWTTAFSVTPTLNLCGENAATLYQSQTSGNLAEIVDSVFYNNADYMEATARDVFNPMKNNVFEPAQSPIKAIDRQLTEDFMGTPIPVIRGGKVMEPVIGLDPRAAGEALQVNAPAPANGFYTAAGYRGAFSPDPSEFWLAPGFASVAFGFVSVPCPGDTNGDNMINIDDIVNVVLDFGFVGSDAPNGGDANGDEIVNIDDIVFVVLNFGQPCPGA